MGKNLLAAISSLSLLFSGTASASSVVRGTSAKVGAKSGAKAGAKVAAKALDVGVSKKNAKLRVLNKLEGDPVLMKKVGAIRNNPNLSRNQKIKEICLLCGIPVSMVGTMVGTYLVTRWIDRLFGVIEVKEVKVELDGKFTSYEHGVSSKYLISSFLSSGMVRDAIRKKPELADKPLNEISDVLPDEKTWYAPEGMNGPIYVCKSVADQGKVKKGEEVEMIEVGGKLRERVINALEDYAEAVNKKAGDAEKKYDRVVCELLRLKQCCGYGIASDGSIAVVGECFPGAFAKSDGFMVKLKQYANVDGAGGFGFGPAAVTLALSQVKSKIASNPTATAIIDLFCSGEGGKAFVRDMMLPPSDGKKVKNWVPPHLNPKFGIKG